MFYWHLGVRGLLRHSVLFGEFVWSCPLFLFLLGLERRLFSLRQFFRRLFFSQEVDFIPRLSSIPILHSWPGSWQASYKQKGGVKVKGWGTGDRLGWSE
jgi:hypothetical protein